MSQEQYQQDILADRDLILKSMTDAAQTVKDVNLSTIMIMYASAKQRERISEACAMKNNRWSNSIVKKKVALCPNCMGHQADEYCPLLVCNRCGMVGHIRRECNQRLNQAKYSQSKLINSLSTSCNTVWNLEYL